jgi:hypothetical protein
VLPGDAASVLPQVSRRVRTGGERSEPTRSAAEQGGGDDREHHHDLDTDDSFAEQEVEHSQGNALDLAEALLDHVYVFARRFDAFKGRRMANNHRS